jgi:hypothetical protein
MKQGRPPANQSPKQRLIIAVAQRFRLIVIYLEQRPIRLTRFAVSLIGPGCSGNPVI